MVADSELAAERDQRRRAFAEVLRRERDTTDLNLDRERVVSDEALAAREAFLAMINHDLRTLVGGIGLNLALLVKDVVVDDERGRRIVKRIDAIERTTARMNRLIDDLLDVVGIQAGKMSVNPIRRDAIAVVRDALVDLAPSASAKGIALSTDFGRSGLKGELLVASFDHDRVLQVLENLVGNAVKFTPSGGRIIVRVEPADDVVRFAVEDTGSGVTDREVPVIFEPFVQGENLSRHGLGLGLYISKRIVEAHGGTIWLDKTSEQGSVFCFTIPRSAAPTAMGAEARPNT